MTLVASIEPSTRPDGDSYPTGFGEDGRPLLKFRRQVPILVGCTVRCLHNSEFPQSESSEVPFMLSFSVSGSRTAIVAAATFLAVSVAPAQAQTDSSTSSFTVALNQDNFFGFYPTFAGTYAPSKSSKVDVAFYGTLWTIPAFNVGGPANGANLWTEFGVGARIRVAGERLSIKPQIGITNGSLLSGAPEGGSPNAFDGIVPSVTINHSSERTEGEIYSGYYRSAREVGPVQLDFLHYWANAGVKFAHIASAGVHLEQLRNSRTTAPGASPSNTYRWIGGYVQFTLPHSSSFARLTVGQNVLDGATGGFYKLSTGTTF